MPPGDIKSTSVNSPCDQQIFCQHSVRPGDLPSDCVNFRATIRPSINFCEVSLRRGDFPVNSINFPCGREIFCQLPSTFRAAGNSSVIFRELCVRPVDAASISVLPVDLPSTSINFRVAGIFSTNFRQLSERRENLCQLLSILCAPGGFSSATSTSVWPEDYQSTFLEAVRPSVNYH